MPDIPVLATQIAVLFLSLSIHESAHAYAAWRFGDPTAKLLGRITLNPIKHIDLIGTIVLPLSIILINLKTGGNIPVFGWAKPVPVNTLNFRNRLRDTAWVSFAGPLSNMALALSGFIFLKFFFRVAHLPQDNPLVVIFLYLLLINAVLFLFNLIPLPPLDGAAVLAGFVSQKFGELVDRLGPLSFIILLGILWTGVFDVVVGFVVRILISWI
jgi:Zn-dependent protease